MEWEKNLGCPDARIHPERPFSLLYPEIEGYLAFKKYLPCEPFLKKGPRAADRIWDPPGFFSQGLYYEGNAGFFQ
jgi:hypothetical protein